MSIWSLSCLHLQYDHSIGCAPWFCILAFLVQLNYWPLTVYTSLVPTLVVTFSANIMQIPNRSMWGRSLSFANLSLNHSAVEVASVISYAKHFFHLPEFSPSKLWNQAYRFFTLIGNTDKPVNAVDVPVLSGIYQLSETSTLLLMGSTLGKRTLMRTQKFRQCNGYCRPSFTRRCGTSSSSLHRWSECQHSSPSLHRRYECLGHSASTPATPLTGALSQEQWHSSLGASSPARVSAHGGRDPGKPAWPEHFLRSGGMSLSANHSSSLMFTNAFDSVLIFMTFWKADPHFWNRKGCWEAVIQSCCVLHRGAVG